MADFEMASSVYSKKVLTLHIAAIAATLISLVLPWWTLIAFVDSEIVATYNLFLWGFKETGFLWTYPLPFEWFSYIVFAMIAIGSFLGLIGYRFLAKGKKHGKLLVALEAISTMVGFLFYLAGLFFTFADPELLYRPVNSWWMIAPSGNHGPLAIARLDVFAMRSAQGLTIMLFLSIGFFLAVLASALSLITFFKLREHPPSPLHTAS